MRATDYQSLLNQWDSLEVNRSVLLRQHQADQGAFLEEEPWYDQLQAIEGRMDVLLAAIEQLETSELLDSREFLLPSEFDAAVFGFAWDHWEKWALEDGVESFLAKLGRDVIREAHMHNWPEELKTECGWSDSGREMLRLAQKEPERAQIRWKYLLDSDGDFHWCK